MDRPLIKAPFWKEALIPSSLTFIVTFDNLNSNLSLEPISSTGREFKLYMEKYLVYQWMFEHFFIWSETWLGYFNFLNLKGTDYACMPLDVLRLSSKCVFESCSPSYNAKLSKHQENSTRWSYILPQIQAKTFEKQK